MGIIVDPTTQGISDK
ncbi:phage holin [Bacillus atrophaeus]|nr:phage holin [Bacillus atrophaeus]